jgi:hypothetical protein
MVLQMFLLMFIAVIHRLFLANLVLELGVRMNFLVVHASQLTLLVQKKELQL